MEVQEVKEVKEVQESPSRGGYEVRRCKGEEKGESTCATRGSKRDSSLRGLRSE
jgi:hypothetical protein